MRVVALAPYPAQAPSTRFRLTQFVEPLRRQGIELEVLPFVGSEEYRELYGPGGTLRKVGLLARSLRRRAAHLREAEEADLVLVHRELAPLGGGFFLRRLQRLGVPVAFDFDDAVFLPSTGGNPLLRHLRRPGKDTAELCRAAHLVLAGNDYLASFARESRGGEEGIRLLPTVVDTEVFRPAAAADEPSGEEGLPVVGWIGTHTTMPYLMEILPGLEAARGKVPFRLQVVSNRPPELEGELEVEFIPWSKEAEMSVLGGLDVGLYPLPDDPWTRGKCGLKGIQYMACGIPVLASPVGVLGEIVRDGEDGFLVRGDEAWARALLTLLRDRQLRKRMGASGRARAFERYSVQAVREELAGWLRATTRESMG